MAAEGDLVLLFLVLGAGGIVELPNGTKGLHEAGLGLLFNIPYSNPKLSL